MKWYWYPWIAASALYAFGELYDKWPESRSGALAKVENQCVREFKNAGYEKASVTKTCACMVERADQWKSENPDGDYTKPLHRKFVATCANRNGLAKAKPKVRTRPLPPPDPVVEQRLREAGALAPRQKAPPSDWGGDGGFAEDGAWD